MRLVRVRVPAQAQARAQAPAKPVGGSRTTMKSGRGGRGSWGRCEGEGGHIVVGGGGKERANQPRIDETYPCRSQIPSGLHLILKLNRIRQKKGKISPGVQARERDMRGGERGGEI